LPVRKGAASPALADGSTPWTALKGVKTVQVEPLGRPVVAEIIVSGSKSVSNRALILAGMANGTTQLSGLLRADDTYWCADALKRLGVKVDFEGTEAKITGIGRRRPNSGEIHVGSAGTIARFLPGFLCAGGPGTWRVTASEQMSKRPVGPLFEALRTGGGKIECPEIENGFPAILGGNSFTGGVLAMSGAVSSQFISGVLMAAPQTAKGIDLSVTGGIVQSEYVRITLDVMAHFGAEVEVDADFTRFRVARSDYGGRDMVVEADASTATYFAALAAVTGGTVTLVNLGKNTRQPDYGFLAILARMGAKVVRRAASTMIAGRGPLKGGFSVDMRPLSDATLTLAAIAPFADGPITMTGVAHIRHHESDRIAAMCAALNRLGVRVEEHEDGLTVYPGAPKFAAVRTEDDHRMAMALSVLGAAGAGVELDQPGCVSKTCPGFFDQLGELGITTKTAL
jgi:3-phosphoshikimate 1-carboxyvinyltransferase